MLDLLAGLPSVYYGWISLLFILIAVIYWFGVSGYTLTSHVSLPGPKPWPYLGNLLDASKYGGLHKAFLEYAKKYGKVYKMYMGRDAIIAVADPEILKHILVKDFQKFRNRPDFLAGKAPLDKGLFGARDDDWKRVRSILTPTFSSSKLKEIVPIMEEAANILLSKFENFAKEEKSVDVSTPFCHFTLDIILSAGFGMKAEIQTNPDPELVEKATTVFMVPVYVRALSMFPFHRQLRKFVDLNPIQHVPYFAKLAEDILELRRSGSVGRRDLVQLMLEATEVTNNNEVKRLTDEEIIGQCITFLVAGSETTGSTLAMIAHHLASYPEIQEKLLREIDDATRSRGDVSIQEFVQSLEYLDRFVSEVLRLCTVGYVNVRDCMETCVINGVEFPAGVGVYILSYCVHRDPDYWPEPEKFDPDRFLPEVAEKRPAFTYLPFGLGPKQCIGIRMALLEMKIALVKILQKMKFERGVGSTETIKLHASTILVPLEPICLKVVARSRDDE
ncbi:Thromboxane-A synthase [Desmophyllum pertusum]|uniref:Thromboxane-A synthase n=1 Tax=Desmophyllum pertusum TaxID=174260 RepID=A0A9W9Z1Z4_9CNID|nr:Thromboxane-A synthase [Desmophyllum pertusum]